MTSMDHADRECARLQRSLSAGLRLPAVPSLGDFGDLFDALGAPTAHDDLAADPFGLADPFDFGAPPPTKAQQFDLQFGLARARIVDGGVRIDIAKGITVEVKGVVP